MSNFMIKVSNVFSPYRIARAASKCGMENLSTRILERNFGKQIGRTSESGLRAFSGKWSDGTRRIEVIDKDFNRRANAIIERDNNGVLDTVHRFLFKDGKTKESYVTIHRNPVNVGEGNQKDLRVVHYVNEYNGTNRHRIGSWTIYLPEQSVFIDRNDHHILDYLIKR